MDKIDGFSLTEVLISLGLLTTTSLALIKQQWHTTQFFNQLLRQNHALIQLNNATEDLIAKSPGETCEYGINQHLNNRDILRAVIG